MHTNFASAEPFSAGHPGPEGDLIIARTTPAQTLKKAVAVSWAALAHSMAVGSGLFDYSRSGTAQEDIVLGGQFLRNS